MLRAGAVVGGAAAWARSPSARRAPPAPPPSAPAAALASCRTPTWPTPRTRPRRSRASSRGSSPPRACTTRRTWSRSSPSADPVIYIDAGLGEQWPSRLAARGVVVRELRRRAAERAVLPAAHHRRRAQRGHRVRRYPALLGSEFRFLSSLTFDRHGKIIRWIDYWDGRSSLVHLPIGTLGPYPDRFPRQPGPSVVRHQERGQAAAERFAAADPRPRPCFTPTRSSRTWHCTPGWRASSRFSATSPAASPRCPTARAPRSRT